MPLYRGECRITVVSVAGDCPQRVTVKVRDGADIEIPGTSGESRGFEAEEWDLVLEHQIQGRWRQNARAVVGKWAPLGEDRQVQTIRSRDVEGSVRAYGDSLVLRLERSSPFARTSAASGSGVPQRPAQPADWDGPRAGGPAVNTEMPPMTSSGGMPFADRREDARTTSTAGPVSDDLSLARRTSSSADDFM